MLDVERIGVVLTRQVGFAVGAALDEDSGNVLVRPLGIHPNESFSVECQVEWRRVRCKFVPGKFARDLVEQMSRSSVETRRRFGLLAASLEEEELAELRVRVNGIPLEASASEEWPDGWTSFEASLDVGPLVIPAGSRERESLITDWSGKLLTLVSMLLPLVEEEGAAEDEERDLDSGFEEGAERTVQSRRYERDPRNRAICLAVRGHRCQGCGIDFEEAYGSVAAGFIHVHHLEPVSTYGAPREIDPTQDLLPLCPNCHAVVHRRTPPYTLDELHEFLKQ